MVDRSFVNDIIKLGGEGIKRCFNCGTCTAICPISEAVTTSFRKMIKYIQLGLKEKVLQSSAMWMCAECRECVAECPRDAKPSNILAALRKYALSSYTWYNMTRSLTLSRWTITLIALIPTILLLGVIALIGKMEPNVVTAGFESFIPTIYVDVGGIAIGILVLIGVIYSLIKFGSYLKKGSTREKSSENPVKSFFAALFKELFAQKMLYRCGKERTRWIAHLMVVWGFIAAAATTSLIFILGLETPLKLTHPVKILGNTAAALLLIGGTILFTRRILRKDLDTAYYDWAFLSLIYIVTWSGILTEITRLMNIAIAAYPLYVIHLITVAVLLVLAPYTKFAHAVYRPLTAFIGRVEGWVRG